MFFFCLIFAVFFLQIDIGFDDFGGDVFVHLRFVVDIRDDNAEGDLRIFRRVIAGKGDIVSPSPPPVSVCAVVLRLRRSGFA